ncbi:DUF1800 family protein [Aestuariibacter sp. GS-14]|uniref:DUF1800 domain-containing protein n=1 Tax=Aestuariibacter sp. GS-14 TaxID=2590670 RepID=UPI0015E82FCC|nr:DUF1800 domain-containing protein [Aestuariibacter sp. GS-14]
MRSQFFLCLFVLISLAGCGGGEESASPAPTPGPTPTPQPSPELTDEQAVRLLMQASFGPTDASVAQVAQSGAEQWLIEQFALPVTEHLPLLDSTFPQDEIYSHHWVETWWQRSVYAEDQLRQRVAFSLSQIFVVSTKDARLLVDPRGVTSYYDTLLNHSFGNFRDLLEAVTLHPMMGMYLSMLGNEKPDEERNIRPDENFAREVMQLFTIGLVELNQDGSVVTDEQGQPVATYDQDIIKGFAHVFTGWHFAGRANWWDDNYDGLSPMQPYEAFHDRSEKHLLNGTIVPARQNARADLAMALDNLFNHPNVGPFIGKQLIQRLVTSNPSPDYIERVAAAFNDNGNGVRGDMQAVIKAILLDDEARILDTSGTGKLRDPLLRIAHVMRVFQSRARDGGMGHEFVSLNIGMAPLDSPSVFNFYRPDYSAPGTIREEGLVSPEFQITNEISITRYVNYMFYMAWFNNLRGDEIIENDAGIVNFDRLAALSGNHDALLDYLNLMLLDGQMNDTMRTILMEALDYWSQGDADWVKLANVVYLITISPQFAVQQ